MIGPAMMPEIHVNRDEIKELPLRGKINNIINIAQAIFARNVKFVVEGIKITVACGEFCCGDINDDESRLPHKQRDQDPVYGRWWGQ